MNRITKTFAALGLFISIINLSCKKEILPDNEASLSKKFTKGHVSDELSNSIVIDWSNAAFEASGGAAEANSLLASRIKAMTHIAIHDALNAIDPVYKQYSYHQQDPLADPFAAAASAAHTVLKASWPDSAAMLDATLSASLSNIPAGPAKTQGIALGIAAGNAILALRAGDGAYQNIISDVPPSTVPGVYVAVPPYNFMAGASWGNMQLFSLETNVQFRSSPPPPLNSPTYARDVNEIKAVGELNSTVRTADQTAYAKWWFELSDIGWNRIAIVQATNHDMGLYATARMFALLNMAMADAYTSSFNDKYYYYTWRPYTAIRAAGTDGNDRTEPDPDWEPLLPTPPVPDYPSTHCTLGNAAAAVLAYFFGNHSPFTSTSTTSATPGETRSFKSFKEAADENASSRIMVGIHFRFACDAGQKLGDKVGAWTVKNHLEPLH